MSNAQKKAATVDKQDRLAARAALRGLRAGGMIFVETAGIRSAMPESLTGDVKRLLQSYAAGSTPTVLSGEDEVSTQEAALILGLSRPTVAKMVDNGRIPSRKPGAHRRIRRADLLAFKTSLDDQRSTALDALVRLGQEQRAEDLAAGRDPDDMT